MHSQDIARVGPNKLSAGPQLSEQVVSRATKKKKKKKKKKKPKMTPLHVMKHMESEHFTGVWYILSIQKNIRKRKKMQTKSTLSAARNSINYFFQ